MRIGIIGAGKVGFALALGLREKGFAISGVYSRSPESSRLLNARLDTSHENSPVQTVKNSDVIFLSVPDDEIWHVTGMIGTQAEHADICGKTFLHCSGALTSEILDPLRQQGGYTGSLHPIQTFADRTNGWIGLEGIYFGFEGGIEAQKCAERVVSAFNGSMVVIEKENKPLYHAAACILSNYLVTLSFAAGNLLGRAGVDSSTGIRAFTPLVEKTVKNIEMLGSLNALTGPISRGDCKVVEGHIKALKEKSPETVDIYKALGRATVGIALSRGSISRENADRLYGILEDTVSSG